MSPSQDIFVHTVLKNKVKLKPQLIGSNLKNVLEWTLKHRFEGRCSSHGYIKKNSIRVTNFSMGRIISSSLNGDSEFVVEYKADVCNPAINSIVQAIVTTKNNFGILAESYVMDGRDEGDAKHDKHSLSILEIISVKTHHDSHEIDFDEVKEGDHINIQILGKKFELNDRKISAWGKLVTQSKNTLLDEVEYYENEDNDRDGDDVISIDGSDIEAEEIGDEKVQKPTNKKGKAGHENEDDDGDDDEDEDELGEENMRGPNIASINARAVKGLTNLNDLSEDELDVGEDLDEEEEEEDGGLDEGSEVVGSDEE